MPLSEEFCESPYQFMNKHILIVKLGPRFTKPAGNVVTAFVVEDPDALDIEAPPHRDSKVCYLRLTDDPDAPNPPRHTRQVYWCHYEYNTSHGTVLGNRHTYMFTPQMDGCTFGIGSQPGGGVVRVVHSNAGEFGKPFVTGPGGVVASLQMQAHKQTANLDAKFAKHNASVEKVVSPFSYMKGNQGIDFRRKATTFGRRSEKDVWKFYSMVYRSTGTHLVHCGVKDFTHGFV